MGLLVNGELGEAQWSALEQTFSDTLDVYHRLSQRTPNWIELSQESYGELTAIAIVRDVLSLSPEEIYTIVEFFRERFPDRLVSEAIEFAHEDEWIAQDEMIADLLADVEEGRKGRNLIAIREDGRVMVFQK